jgi:hypothetical protein
MEDGRWFDTKGPLNGMVMIDKILASLAMGDGSFERGEINY